MYETYFCNTFLRYYSEAVHGASFVLPKFAADELDQKAHVEAKW